MMRRLGAFLCVAIVFIASPAWSACLQAEHEAAAEGWLKSERFRDAANRPEKAYILHLDDAVCLEGSDAADKVEHARIIHVFSSKSDLSKRLKRFVGKSVRVRGKPFGALTAHHHAPIVMDVNEISER
jgi:Domain of unknown function (DUF4431)